MLILKYSIITLFHRRINIKLRGCNNVTRKAFWCFCIRSIDFDEKSKRYFFIIVIIIILFIFRTHKIFWKGFRQKVIKCETECIGGAIYILCVRSPRPPLIKYYSNIFLFVRSSIFPPTYFKTTRRVYFLLFVVCKSDKQFYIGILMRNV